MSGLPAAVLFNFHICPAFNGLQPHVGGPIIQGANSVIIEGRPAARIGDKAICMGPLDSIAAGSMRVKIEHKPAARLFDRCAHGGLIVEGCPRTIIG